MAVDIAPLDSAALPRLREMWLALHAHHQQVAPELAPYVTPAESWPRRQWQYHQALAGGGFGFIAQVDAQPAGYLICAQRPMQWQATFPLPPQLWELVTLVVKPEYRNRGIGGALLDLFETRVAAAEFKTRLIGALPQNTRAISLYQSRDYVPAWLTLTRFRRQAIIPDTVPDVRIDCHVADDVSAYKALWLELHHHHQAVSPNLHPFLEDARSWPEIDPLLAESAGNGLLFIARVAGKAAGLASVAIYDAPDLVSYSDTWATGERVAETKFLVVGEAYRGRGIGAALMDTVERAMLARDVTDHLIGAIAPNAGAIRFYQSRGFRPAWLELFKR
jgi:ribosomal protein S18 acetylase RimI-like enzyme